MEPNDQQNIVQFFYAYAVNEHTICLLKHIKGYCLGES